MAFESLKKMLNPDDQEYEEEDEVMINGSRPKSYNPYRDEKPVINPFIHIISHCIVLTVSKNSSSI